MHKGRKAQKHSFKGVLGTRHSRNFTHTKKFPRKIYLNEFFCSQVRLAYNFTNKWTATHVHFKNVAYIFRIPFSSSQWLLQKVYKGEFFLENWLVWHPIMNSSMGAERSPILAIKNFSYKKLHKNEEFHCFTYIFQTLKVTRGIGWFGLNENVSYSNNFL